MPMISASCQALSIPFGLQISHAGTNGISAGGLTALGAQAAHLSRAMGKPRNLEEVGSTLAYICRGKPCQNGPFLRGKSATSYRIVLPCISIIGWHASLRSVASPH